MAEKDYKMVTIRLPKERVPIYEDFKEFVIKEQHSDICYVTSSLWEAYLRGMKEIPNMEDPVSMKFPRQNIQINMGCNFNYIPRKGRRQPPGIQDPLSQPRVEMNKNLFFPLLLEEWETLSEEKKQFWLQRLTEQGIIPPGIVKTNKQKKFDCMEQSTTIVYKPSLMRFLRWMVTPL